MSSYTAAPPTAQTLEYADLVSANVAETNQVNLEDYNKYGHRVQVSMPVAALNAALTWSRTAGSSRPVGHFKSSGAAAFATALASAVDAGFLDVDAVSHKLSFDSSVFDTNSDSRIRENGISANDLVMAYVLYKVYGSSDITTQGQVFNLEDAWGMLSTQTLVDAVKSSFSAAEALSSNTGNEKGAIDAMFRDLLAADPARFFDSNGKQVAGLYETKADADASGNWNLIVNDTIEVRVEFTFGQKVTLRTTRDVSQALSEQPALTDANTETTVINAGDKFYIRLQVKASA